MSTLVLCTTSLAGCSFILNQLNVNNLVTNNEGKVTTASGVDPLFHLATTSEVAAKATVLAQTSILTCDPAYAETVGDIRDWPLVSSLFYQKMNAHISCRFFLRHFFSNTRMVRLRSAMHVLVTIRSTTCRQKQFIGTRFDCRQQDFNRYWASQ